MAQNKKPEWFEITDADEKPELRKVSKSLPVSAVMVAALILGAGAVVAQNQSKTPTSAVAASSVESNPTTQAVSTVKAAATNPSTAAVAGGAATSKLANPSIAQLPTGGGDDDDDEDDEGDDD